MASRKKTSDDTEADVLVTSRRRCALCYGLYADLDQKRGQIAHVDRDSSNSAFDNLCFLCLPHHDEYDTKTSQSKRFSPTELLRYRDQLYDRLGKGFAAEQAAAESASPALRDAARQEACVELERDAGFLFERFGSNARLEPDEEALWATIKRFESNIGLVRRDQPLTQAVRDLAHECKILLSDRGMFDQPQKRMSEIGELRRYFDTFICESDRFSTGSPATSNVAQASHIDTTPFFSLVGGSFSAGVLDLQLRNDGAHVTCLTFDTTTVGCHVRQWYPSSLPTTELFKASVDLGSDIPKCAFLMRVRDRAGAERTFHLRLDRQSSPQRFDFSEVT